MVGVCGEVAESPAEYKPDTCRRPALLLEGGGGVIAGRGAAAAVVGRLSWVS